jgi:hypothetical protein
MPYSPEMPHSYANVSQETTARPETSQEQAELRTVNNLDADIIKNWLKTRIGDQASGIEVPAFRNGLAKAITESRSFRYLSPDLRTDPDEPEDVDGEVDGLAPRAKKKPEIYAPDLPERLIVQYENGSTLILCHTKLKGPLDFQALLRMTDKNGTTKEWVMLATTSAESGPDQLEKLKHWADELGEFAKKQKAH